MSGNKKQNPFIRSILFTAKFVSKLLLLVTLFNIFLIIFFRFIIPPTSAFINEDSYKSFANLWKISDSKPQNVALNKISKNVLVAVIASEDQRFFDHFGFDFTQIEKAIKENERRKRVRGASTISMQTAKNLFLWSGKNFLRKGVEAYYTILLELLWSKERILEVYLNIAEMGKGIYGVGNAASIYFHKTPNHLTLSEAASLAAVLPNPKMRDPRKPSRYLLKRQSQILHQIDLLGGSKFLKDNLN